MKYKLLAGHEAVQVGSTNGSNFSSSTVVRLYNSDTAFHVVSVETSANVLIGSIHIGAGQSIDLHKDPTDEVFSDSTTVFGTPVATNA